jgi:protein gp37
MSDNTKIEWCDASWPVIRGCTKCSPGCDNCWAIADAHLHAGAPNAKARAHFAGLTQIQNGRPNWTGEVRLDESILELPLHWKKPRKVFVASSGDLFHESLPFDAPCSSAYILDSDEARATHVWV